MSDYKIKTPFFQAKELIEKLTSRPCLQEIDGYYDRIADEEQMVEIVQKYLEQHNTATFYYIIIELNKLQKYKNGVKANNLKDYSGHLLFKDVIETLKRFF